MCTYQLQWNLYITDTLGPQMLYIIWRCPLHGGYKGHVQFNELVRHVVSLLVMLFWHKNISKSSKLRKLEI